MRTEMRPINTLSRGGGEAGTGGGPLLVIGGAFIIFWVICLMTQVTTNEAWINHAKSVEMYRPNFGVFLQVPFLLLGWIPSDQVNGVIFGWGIELVFLAITFAGIELIHHSVHQSGRILGILFEIIAFAATCFNWYTDYNYGTISPGSEWGHTGFAFMNAIVVAYFGVIGWNLLKAGWSRI